MSSLIRIITGHGSLGQYLKRLNIISSAACVLYENDDETDEIHLLYWPANSADNNII